MCLTWPGLYTVEVGVALGRPPREDTSVWVHVQADGEIEAMQIAAQMACGLRGVVMPVSTKILSCVL